MLSAGGQTGGPGAGERSRPDGAPHRREAAIVEGEPVPGGHHVHDVAESMAAVEAAGGQRPLRLVGLGIVLLTFGFLLRWGQDVTAPYVNVGEAHMAAAVVFESDGGTYRVVSSGPTRPELHFTVCEATAGDGSTQRERGRDGVNGGHQRLGVTRVTKFDLPAGQAEIRCGNREPTRGAGLGRFQVVDADGPVSLAVTGLIGGGAAGLLAGIGWFLLRFFRSRH